MKYSITFFLVMTSLMSLAQNYFYREPDRGYFIPFQFGPIFYLNPSNELNYRLEQLGYNNIVQNEFVSFSNSYQSRKNYSLQLSVFTGNNADSEFRFNKKAEWNTCSFETKVGYNIIPFKHFQKIAVMPSFGIYAGRDKIVLSERFWNTSFGEYDIAQKIIKKKETGISPSMQISFSPFRNHSLISLYSFNIEYGINYFITRTFEDKSNKREPAINSKNGTSYLNIKFEFGRGLFPVNKKERRIDKYVTKV